MASQAEPGPPGPSATSIRPPVTAAMALQQRIDEILQRMEEAGAREDYAEALALQSQLPPLREALQLQQSQESSEQPAEDEQKPRGAAPREIVELPPAKPAPEKDKEQPEKPAKPDNKEKERKPKLSHAKNIATKPALSLSTQKASAAAGGDAPRGEERDGAERVIHHARAEAVRHRVIVQQQVAVPRSGHHLGLRVARAELRD